MIKALKAAILRKAESCFVWMQNRIEHKRVTAIKTRYSLDVSVGINLGTQIYGEGSIEIGEGTYFGRDCYVQCDPVDCKIRIGRNCAIAHNVHIRTTSYPRVSDFAMARQDPLGDSQRIEIGDYVWIGVHAYIGGGVTIGSNSIIGANSVVTKDVPANAVVGGVPARLIHYKSVY